MWKEAVDASKISVPGFPAGTREQAIAAPLTFRKRESNDPSRTWLPDGYSQIFRLYVFGPSGFWTSYTAKFDSFPSLDCARVEGVGAQSKERKGSNFAAQRSGAIVQEPEGPNTYDSKNPAIAIWQPCLSKSGMMISC